MYAAMRKYSPKLNAHVFIQFTRPLATAKENPQLQGANQRGKGAKGGIISSFVVCQIRSHHGDLRDDIPTSIVLFGG